MESLFTIDGNAISSAFTIDQSALTAGLGDMDLDLSNVSVDMPCPRSTRRASDRSESARSGRFGFDLSGIDLSLGGVEPTIDSAAIGAAMSQAMEGFGAWTEHPEHTACRRRSPRYRRSVVSEQPNTAIAGAIDLSGMQDRSPPKCSSRSAAVQQQLVPPIAAALSSAIQSQLQTALQTYMTQTMTAVMTQIGTALQCR